MSDELIEIPQFLATPKAVRVQAAACSWCSEISCETDSMGTCSNGCQTTCEGTCQTSCEGSCQTACQGGCLSCQSCEGCMGTCQSAAQCYEACTSTCEYSCQGCQSGCQASCESSCQSMQGGCYGNCETSSEQSGIRPTESGSITVISTAENSITIQLAAIERATQYEVVWRLASETTLIGSVTITGTTYTITGLSAGTEYAINYKAINVYGEGPFMATPAYAATAGNVFIYANSRWTPATPYVVCTDGNWQAAIGKIF